MKRRGFLGLLGAAITAPVLPAAAPGMTPQIKVLAAAHARKYPFISVRGISARLGVPMKEAERLLEHLSRTGQVGPVNTCATGPMSAASKVFRPVRPGPAAPRLRRSRTPHAAERTHPEERPEVWADLSSFLRHLHRICRSEGLPLHPRAYAALT